MADEYSNSVIVSAPDGLVSIIEQMIGEIDVPIQDITEQKVFKLKNADPVEMAELLANLFTDESNSSSSQNQNSPGFGGFRGALFQAMSGGNKNQNEASSRMKLMGHVNAQPDPRTHSLVVSAAKDLMPGITKIVQQLDEDPANIVKLHTFQVDPANAYDFVQVFNDLFPRPTGLASSSATTSAANNVLLTREQTISQQQNTSAATQNQSFGTTPGR